MSAAWRQISDPAEHPDRMKLPLQNFYRSSNWLSEFVLIQCCASWESSILLNPKIESILLKSHNLGDPWNIAQTLGKNPVVSHLHKPWASTENIPNKAHSRKEEGCFVLVYLGDLLFAVVQCTLILCNWPWKTLHHNHTCLRLPICRQTYTRFRHDVKYISTS